MTQSEKVIIGCWYKVLNAHPEWHSSKQSFEVDKLVGKILDLPVERINQVVENNL